MVHRLSCLDKHLLKQNMGLYTVAQGDVCCHLDALLATLHALLDSMGFARGAAGGVGARGGCVAHGKGGWGEM